MRKMLSNELGCLLLDLLHNDNYKVWFTTRTRIVIVWGYLASNHL